MEEYRRWEVNIKMDLKEIGVDVMNWMELTKVRGSWRAFVNLALDLQIPYFTELNISPLNISYKKQGRELNYD